MTTTPNQQEVLARFTELTFAMGDFYHEMCEIINFVEGKGGSDAVYLAAVQEYMPSLYHRLKDKKPLFMDLCEATGVIERRWEIDPASLPSEDLEDE